MGTLSATVASEIPPHRGVLEYSTISVFCRALFFGALSILTNRALGLETREVIIALSGGCGVLGAAFLAKQGISFRGLLLLLGAGALTVWGIFSVLEPMVLSFSTEVFLIDRIERHTSFALSFFLLGLLTTWFFVRVPGYMSVELIGFLALFVSVFSGHRNFHFDSPKFLNSIAWDLGVSQVTALVVVGILGTLFIATYLFAFQTMSLPAQSIVTKPRPWWSRVAALLAMGAIILFVSSVVQQSFTRLELERATNGVGQERSPGLSPLGFHSALGSTNQPSAMVRLDNDYPQNPHSPMLYLRESALSAFSGRELVIAPRVFDQDVPGNAPHEPFVKEENTEVPGRTKVSFSAYLLTDHNLAFALDFPISISPLKNPNPQRFKEAFRAVSLAPTFKPSDLIFETVGDPSWSKETWDHYLTKHPDERYARVAAATSAGALTPVGKANAIIDFLNANAIYTLTPNHSVTPDGDPVAPFLFGDLRGYCVHFAHAMVYLFRALDIPARIGTGYLTDLSQAKDGHVLLRMSDRHAWAEVYIKDKGWIPFDVKPAQVESHADSQVDQKLLEELVGLVGPDETILPRDLEPIAPGASSPDTGERLVLPSLAPFFLAILLLLYLAKLYIRQGWRLSTSPYTRVRRLYRAAQSWYLDIGHRREWAETRSEFQQRLSEEFGFNCLTVTSEWTAMKYGSHVDASLVERALAKMREERRRFRRSGGITRRLVAFLSPLSVLEYLRGAR